MSMRASLLKGAAWLSSYNVEATQIHEAHLSQGDICFLLCSGYEITFALDNGKQSL